MAVGTFALLFGGNHGEIKFRTLFLHHDLLYKRWNIEKYKPVGTPFKFASKPIFYTYMSFSVIRYRYKILPRGRVYYIISVISCRSYIINRKRFFSTNLLLHSFVSFTSGRRESPFIAIHYHHGIKRMFEKWWETTNEWVIII